MKVKETDFKVGDFVYTIRDNEVYKLRLEKKIIVESFSGEDYVELLLVESSNNEFSMEVPLDDLLTEYFLSFQEVINHLTKKYRSRYEKNKEKPESTIFCDFIETDGYTERHKGYVKLPVKYIKYGGDTSITLTEDGVDWFKKSIHSGFDNGGYYRLVRMSEDKIERLTSDASRILEIFMK